LSGGNSAVFAATLLIPPGSLTSTANTNYTAVYTFQVVGPTATPIAVSPVAYISSGTQVKHTDTGNFATLPPVQPPMLASPDLITAPSPDAVTLGTTPVTLKDTAVPGDGFRPTGTIPFPLGGPGRGTVDTETVTVNGNGTYTTPNGFMLPTTGMVAGTYTWTAHYSGDANNNAANDQGGIAEQTVVSPASPTLTTTPNLTTVTLTPNSVTAPPILQDTAELEGGFNPTGSITFEWVPGSTPG